MSLFSFFELGTHTCTGTRNTTDLDEAFLYTEQSLKVDWGIGSLAWFELATFIEAYESFGIHTLGFAGIGLQTSFGTLHPLFWLQNLGYRTRTCRTELGMWIWHTN